MQTKPGSGSSEATANPTLLLGTDFSPPNNAHIKKGCETREAVDPVTEITNKNADLSFNQLFEHVVN